jgi:hypothetical protein
MTITSAKELAAKAADEIERRGWYDGDLTNNDSDPAGCKVCVLGATGAAYFGDPRCGYGYLVDEQGWAQVGQVAEYVDLLDEIATSVTPEDYRRCTPTSRLYSWNDSYVSDQPDPQQYVIDELRRFAGAA